MSMIEAGGHSAGRGFVPASIAFDVLGEPAPQGSKRALIRGGRAFVIDDNSTRLRRWRKSVVAVAAEQMRGRATLTGAVGVSALFCVRPPKNPMHDEPITRPDLDKYLRACLDALVAAEVMHDDSLVLEIAAKKRYWHNPLTRIVVTDLDGVTWP